MIYDNKKNFLSWAKNLLNEYKLCMASILIYWPYENSCETMALIIKNRVGMLKRKGEKINLRTFKKIINKLTLKEPEEWILKC